MILAQRSHRQAHLLIAEWLPRAWCGLLSSKLAPSRRPLFAAPSLNGLFVKSALAMIRGMSRCKLFTNLRLSTQPVNLIAAMGAPFAKPNLVGAPLYRSSKVLRLHS